MKLSLSGFNSVLGQLYQPFPTHTANRETHKECCIPQVQSENRSFTSDFNRGNLIWRIGETGIEELERQTGNPK